MAEVKSSVEDDIEACSPLCEGQAKNPNDEACAKTKHNQEPCLTGMPKKLLNLNLPKFDMTVDQWKFENNVDPDQPPFSFEELMGCTKCLNTEQFASWLHTCICHGSVVHVEDVKDGVMAVLLIVNMILLFSFTSLVFEWRSKRYIAMEPRASHICVPSTEFYNDTCPASVTKQNYDKECCGKVSDIVEDLISKSMKRAFDEHYPSRLFSGTKTMCTMTAWQQNIFNANGLGSKKDLLSQDSNEALEWAQQQSTPSLFIYLNGKVYVKETRFYFLHSQIKMGPGECVANRNNTAITYYHQIRHFSYRQQKDTVLLENVRHHCLRNCVNFNMTLSTGAIVRLEERDHVYVVTSHPGHIIPCEHDNRFTVFTS